VLAAAAVGTLTGCPAGGGPTSPDPVRFVLAGERDPCRIVFGPVARDIFFEVQEVGEIDTPDGPTFIRRGVVVGDREGPDLEIGGIDVHVSSSAGTVEAVWQLPPSEIGVSTRSLGEDELRELLPALVGTADAPGLARTLVDRIDGAELRYAGPAPGYDVGLAYEDGTLSIAGRGVADTQLDAFYAILDGRTADGGAEWRTDVLGATEGRARDATVIVGSGRDRTAVSGSTFGALVDELMGEDEPTVAISEGRMRTARFGCESPRRPFPGTDATISDVSIAESDVGDLLRITFDGLPADHPDPRLVHVTVGEVELVAEYEGDETVLFPATLTHVEARLLAERLEP
jgi:hypothetical protein